MHRTDHTRTPPNSEEQVKPVCHQSMTVVIVVLVASRTPKSHRTALLCLNSTQLSGQGKPNPTMCQANEHLGLNKATGQVISLHEFVSSFVSNYNQQQYNWDVTSIVFKENDFIKTFICGSVRSRDVALIETQKNHVTIFEHQQMLV